MPLRRSDCDVEAPEKFMFDDGDPKCCIHMIHFILMLIKSGTCCAFWVSQSPFNTGSGKTASITLVTYVRLRFMRAERVLTDIDTKKEVINLNTP